MAKATAPIQEVSRLLDLVPFLSTHSHISLKELAAEFNVSEREMSNELTALSMCGLPGYTPYELIEIFFESGFVTINNHDALDIPRALTSLEVASLLIGLEIMRDGIADQSDSLNQKIDALVKQLSSLIGSSIKVGDNPNTAHLAKINSAIASRSIISIVYESTVAAESSSRDIEPLGIYSEGKWSYLNAYCHKAKGYRNFRLDRVVEIVASTKKSEPLEHPSTVSEKTEVTLTVAGKRRAVAELLQVEKIPTHGKVKVDIFSHEWLKRAVASFAPEISLVEPATARDAVKGFLSDILDLYRS